jgi:hypothetical protein
VGSFFAVSDGVCFIIFPQVVTPRGLIHGQPRFVEDSPDYLCTSTLKETFDNIGKHLEWQNVI